MKTPRTTQRRTAKRHGGSDTHRVQAHNYTFIAAAAALVLVIAAAQTQAATSGPIVPPAPIVPPTTSSPTLTSSTPAATPGAGSLPEIGDVLAVVDKVTSNPNGDKAGDYAAPVKMAIVFAGLALLPAALVMMTSFTRIIIVLSFVRRALTTQNIPPTIAIVGLALFLTLFTMAPTFTQINTDGIRPYLDNKINFQVAIDRSVDHLKDFMIRQTRQSDLAFFIDLAKVPVPETAADVPAHVAIPAFAISEFRTAFEMGCLLFIPFLLIDLVVSGILLSAGMMMLPPSIISLPFKIILFVLVDGWRLLAQSLVTSFN
jgi:flagellar biosynthetic protein FliP